MRMLFLRTIGPNCVLNDSLTGRLPSIRFSEHIAHLSKSQRNQAPDFSEARSYTARGTSARRHLDLYCHDGPPRPYFDFVATLILKIDFPASSQPRFASRNHPTAVA
jgi:hypothetical protein